MAEGTVRMDSYGTDDDEFISAGDYYNDDDVDDFVVDGDAARSKESDPEEFEYLCMTEEGFLAKKRDEVQKLANELQVSLNVAFLIYQSFGWDYDKALTSNGAISQQLIKARARPEQSGAEIVCGVCFDTLEDDPYSAELSMACGHTYCRTCWLEHIIACLDSATNALECMNCSMSLGDTFVENLLERGIKEAQEACAGHASSDAEMNGESCSTEASKRLAQIQRSRRLYRTSLVKRAIESEAPVRFCVAPNCERILMAEAIAPKRVLCECHTQFCFACQDVYHAPLSCPDLKEWLKACANETHTAHYMVTNTKPCPKCKVSIEKNGGCNHMQCSRCRHDFCWVCLEDWKKHGTDYFQCNRYKPTTLEEKQRKQQAEAVKRYFFYFERYQVHKESLALEEVTKEKLCKAIEERIGGDNPDGTWIDYSYLMDACELLAKSRYTLQYTYPYAFYLSPDAAERQLLEYQQARLEHEIETLSFTIERASSSDKADIRIKCLSVEQWRKSLLSKFAA